VKIPTHRGIGRPAARPFAQAEAVAEVPIYRETRSAIKCASACRKFEYFQIFSNVSHHFSNIFEYFQTFSIVFERFQKKLAHLIDVPGTAFQRCRRNGGIIGR